MTKILRRRQGLDAEVTADQLQANSSECGVDEAIIRVLPTFSFSSLKGNKEGLECAVCLVRYADCDVLRMLSTCKHAFHVDCVDTWLHSHSTCPLCRCQITEEDPYLLADGIRSARVSSDMALSTPRRSLEIGGFQIIVERDAGETSARAGRRRQTRLPDKMPSDRWGAGTAPFTDEPQDHRFRSCANAAQMEQFRTS
ncbi:hypothetical protein O6H91_04G123000 [Diphasiastrum complanatum]|uniref:Uncharacterized protein n=1 Tax=Diphasiastrum complanatum TaxID=34168 RepID=A0ACC2E1I6_DIPCM|nr:hypothetical protein O6H91_04G123000 [Diphasiastrum complanatum]